MAFLARLGTHIQFVVHRALLNERKILHRDMSANNILVEPAHNPRTEGADFKLTPGAPRCIAEVLDGADGTHRCVQSCEQLSSRRMTDPLCQHSTSTHDRAGCLIIDFDNSVDLDVASKDKEEELAQQTVCPHILEFSNNA